MYECCEGRKQDQQQQQQLTTSAFCSALAALRFISVSDRDVAAMVSDTGLCEPHALQDTNLTTVENCDRFRAGA